MKRLPSGLLSDLSAQDQGIDCSFDMKQQLREE
jgi:hypothetical protein